MRSISVKLLPVACVACLAGMMAGCGEFVRSSRSPSQLVIVALQVPAFEFRELQGGTGVPGRIETIPGFVTGPLNSDVDSGQANTAQVILRQILRDPGVPGTTAAPTLQNDITVTEYEVRYRLLDGRNTPREDVPYPIRGGLTFTLRGTSEVRAQFDIVRNVAKVEPPLLALHSGDRVVTMIADVTFYGRDQTGNAVSATGSVQINFANFAA